jgi:hypothetical protein
MTDDGEENDHAFMDVALYNGVFLGNLLRRHGGILVVLRSSFGHEHIVVPNSRNSRKFADIWL